MMKVNPLTAIDFYKTDHRRQYPEGTTQVYSNFTPRSAKLAKICQYEPESAVIFFGLQYFIQDFLLDSWNEAFFNKPKDRVLGQYKRRMDYALGKDTIDLSHLAALHDLGYLPIKIKALAEGESVPVGVPVLTVMNTLPAFFWLTNYLETVISSYLWKPITTATTAYQYRKLLQFYTEKTGSDLEFIPFQAHDFSFRGMSGVEDAALSGAAHLTCFYGTDTVHAIDFIEHYYYADVEKSLIGCSVPATEHSVMCMGLEAGELETFERLIQQLYPKGIISIVADTWDFWRVITEYLIILKDKILKREGKVVIRPDSGDPVKIIAGDPDAPLNSPEYKGAVEILWEIFGGVLTSTGHRLLDSHIGLIYGDSITLERADAILDRLDKKGFASGNIVFGIGSYTYQFVTRDNFSFAMKATSGIVNGERRDIFKSPKTDAGTKKSAKGLLRVERIDGKLVLFTQQTEEEEEQGLLQTIYQNGELKQKTTLDDIRQKINQHLKKK